MTILFIRKFINDPCDRFSLKVSDETKKNEVKDREV